jgi:hypothetical protein
MGLTTKTLGELLDYIDSERLKLPEIQREFVWKRQNIKLLFDSLYRGLPIGQMLVWKPKETSPTTRPFHRKSNRRHPTRIDQFYGYLLDGQQRLTAISRIKDGDDDYPLMIDLYPDEEDHDVFFWGGNKTYGPWHLRVSDVLWPDFNILAHIEVLSQEEDFEPHHAEFVRKKLTRLQDILKYVISIIEFESDDHREATELFIRFNSTGKKLNRTDLTLAELATRIQGLTSNKIGEFINAWRTTFPFTRPFLIQCLAAVHTGRMNLQKPKEVWGDSDPKDLERSWGQTARGLDKIIEFLTGTVRWDSASWIPSFNALIPLVYIVAHGGTFNLQDKKLARKWLLLTGVHSYFSGSGYIELDQLLKKLQKEPTVDELWRLTSRKLPKLRAKNDIPLSRRSGPLMSLFISMLRDESAKDWISNNPLDGTVLGKHARLHVHHFFPRALLSRHDHQSEWINTFANYTVLCAGTNWDIATEEPATYMTRLDVQEKQLEAQCIPLDRDLWQVSNYERFLDTREKMLAKRFNEFLGFS